MISPSMLLAFSANTGYLVSAHQNNTMEASQDDASTPAMDDSNHFNNGLFIARFYTVFGVLYGTYCLSKLKQSAKRFGYTLDKVGLDMCKFLLVTLVSVSLLGALIFYDMMDILDAIMVSRLPVMHYILDEKILHFDTKMHKAKVSANYKAYFVYMLLEMIATYSRWEYAFIMPLLIGLVSLKDSIVSFANPRVLLDEYLVEQVAKKPKVGAMNQNISMLLIFYQTFIFGLLFGVLPERAYGISLFLTTICQVAKRTVYNHYDKSIGFNKKEATFWLVANAVVVGNLIL